MAAFGARSLSYLDADGGVKPVTRARAIALAAYVTSHGGDIAVRQYGGRRSMETQAQLYQWRLDSIAAGRGDYAVARPSPTAPHVTGDAFDVEVKIPMTGLTVDQTYKAMADYAPTLGLVAGYYFKNVPSDPFHFENADRSLENDPGAPMGSSPDATGGFTQLSIVAVLAVVLLLLLLAN